MIDPDHPRLSIMRQCDLASISRSSFYREPTAESEETLRLMRLIDEQFLETPWYGSRQMARHLRRQGWCVGRHRVRRLMAKMGLAPIYQRPKTSEPHPHHKVYPYLLRHLTIDRPNQVWCADVTYIQMRRGFLYLVAIMDWASRKVLAWRLSNTMDADFCVAALEEAIVRHGKPGHGPMCEVHPRLVAMRLAQRVERADGRDDEAARDECGRLVVSELHQRPGIEQVGVQIAGR